MAALRYNAPTNTLETGGMYAGKPKADMAEARRQATTTSPFTAKSIREAKAAAGTPKPGGLDAYGTKGTPQNALMEKFKSAAVAQVDSELQDEMSAENALQAERTANYANTLATAARPPGGSIRRGAATIGQASGAGLSALNRASRRAAKVKAAETGAELDLIKQALDRRQPGQVRRY